MICSLARVKYLNTILFYHKRRGYCLQFKMHKLKANLNYLWISKHKNHLPLYVMEPGLRCPEVELSGDALVRQADVGDSVGLFLRPAECLRSDAMGMVAFMGPCLTGEDFLVRDAVDMIVNSHPMGNRIVVESPRSEH